MLLGAGFAPERLGAVLGDPLLGADGPKDLRLEAAIEGVPSRLIDVGGGTDDRLRQPEGIEGGLGLSRIDQVIRRLLALADIGSELLPQDILHPGGFFQGGLGGRFDGRGLCFGRGRRLRAGGGRVLQHDPADALQTAQATTGLVVVRVELQRLVEESPRLGSFALRQGLTTELDQLLRERWRLGGAGSDA